MYFNLNIVYLCPAEFIFVSLSLHLQAAVVQHDWHSDEQHLGSLGVKQQAEEHAC